MFFLGGVQRLVVCFFFLEGWVFVFTSFLNRIHPFTHFFCWVGIVVSPRFRQVDVFFTKKSLIISFIDNLMGMSWPFSDWYKVVLCQLYMES